MSAEQDLRKAVLSVLDKGKMCEEMAEDVVRHLRFARGQSYLITNGNVYGVTEAEVIDGMDDELAWNVYTTDEDKDD